VPALYIHRDLEPVLARSIAQFPAVAVSGPRQAGKSTLLRQAAPTHQYISFDDPVVREQARADPNLFFDSLGERVILDEIQYVPEILSYLKMKIDADRGRKGRFLLTGSQRFPLIKGLGDTLAGRIALLDLLPFSVQEIRRVPGREASLRSAEACFLLACLTGSFPEPVISSPDPGIWYGSYLQTYLERDVRTLHDIGKLRDFQRFLQLLASRCGQVLNHSTLAGEIGVSVNTIRRWVSVLEASQILFLLPPYYRNLGKRITKSPKVYFLDAGLVCHLVGLKDKDHLLRGPMAGSLFENFCIQEAVKTFAFRGRAPRLFYLRTHNGLEIDLLVELSGELFPVELKLTKTPRAALGAGIERFRSLFAGLPVREGRIVSLGKTLRLARDMLASTVDEFLGWLGGELAR
jgi:predicted AAA+ superfamily ATPase